jgi:leader peptidase (prepilin peptidase) / N-methyltransferase
MLIIYWLFVVFVVGAVVGSFLNVAISRLPLEKSLIWPRSRCGHCLQPIAWKDNLPLISYLWLRGKCRNCGAKFSSRYFWVELATALGFVGLFYLEVVENIHDWPAFGRDWAGRYGLFPWQWWAGFTFHAILFSFLLTASACDLDGREIPLSLTLSGAVVGLVGSAIFPWPWPRDAATAVPRPNLAGTEWMDPFGGLKNGLYAWPLWGPIPAWAGEPGSWQLGLATGLAGFLVGSFLMRGIRVLFSVGLGKEALGLGDADLMMMAGCFLGWQPVLISLFVSVLPALIVGFFQMIFARDNSLPFGPSLAGGILITMLGWTWIGAYAQPLLFWGTLLMGMAAVGAVLMLASSLAIRWLRGESPGTPGGLPQ